MTPYIITPSGTAYKDTTPSEVISSLEYARENNIRVILDYGDVKTGKSWGDKYGITGYVGRSTGEIKIPILVHNSRSLGGRAILDDAIINIRYANKKHGGYLYTWRAN